MNRFEKFLKESGIATGGRHSTAERASYFLWYHLRATGESDADLEVIQKYLVESGTRSPDLQELYKQLIGENQMVVCVSIPGRLRMKPEWNTSMEKVYGAKVFQLTDLTPLYFWRAPDGALVRISSMIDLVKYWPQRSWVAAWLMTSLGFLGLITPLVLSIPQPSTIQQRFDRH